MTDPINRPAHYCYSPVEPMDVIEAWSLNYALGNVVKYVARCHHKGHAVTDLLKARWYLDREIARQQRGET